ncbi:MAG: hypothetical protein MUF49_09155 [Oculatellaceae cyanobacterium Prado106]|jgi:hypothetical protein|nr:hypothetical protein [Oculatellaceae cyanobacterium Prado106]
MGGLNDRWDEDEFNSIHLAFVDFVLIRLVSTSSGMDLLLDCIFIAPAVEPFFSWQVSMARVQMMENLA